MTNYNIRANKTDRASPGAACSTSSRRLRSRVRTELTDCGSSGLEFIRICASRMASRNRTGSVLEGPSNGFRPSFHSVAVRAPVVASAVVASSGNCGSVWHRWAVTAHLSVLISLATRMTKRIIRLDMLTSHYRCIWNFFFYMDRFWTNIFWKHWTEKRLVRVIWVHILYCKN